ncbi:7254_t:CDS:1, partial [Funneliformis caledonium]
MIIHLICCPTYEVFQNLSQISVTELMNMEIDDINAKNKKK